MAKVVNNVLELIGDTPVVKLNKLGGEDSAEIYAKLEMFNPLSSVKDRIGLSMIEAAEKEGKLKAGDTLVEPTSGNTGIALAFVAAVKGYKMVLTMPETMSVERRKVLKAFGAELVLTDGTKGMKGAIDKAKELSEEKGWVQPQQFNNPANPEVHRKTTAVEVIEQVPELDAFVSGIGTGGTITGVGELLKEKGKKVHVVAVEPVDSAVLSGGDPGPHKIQGIGAGFVPTVLNTEVYDEIVKVSNEDAFETARKLAKEEGLFVGISSGAAAWAALQVANKLGKGKKVVVVLPDHGERYLSTPLFGEE
ncbi:MAG: cysteine synthase A [Candidatus Woesearchaeota archaeon]|jgi:cysteine synthase A|nr:cysteine synthase A [Candidatus Woesearchaeota archaeon]MDP7458439.1 cysteine synthase A [Candidatus Woesearchaeota archaeon]